MDIAYGIKVQESGDRYISIAEEVVNAATEASIPGAFWVDLFPILEYVPSWFPGAGFQKKAAHSRKLNATLVGKPFRYVQEQLVGEPFSRMMNLFICSFCRKLARLRHRWQQPLLSDFLMKMILNGPWRKRLRKMWLL
jgi:hypothetical protein